MAENKSTNTKRYQKKTKPVTDVKKQSPKSENAGKNNKKTTKTQSTKNPTRKNTSKNQTQNKGRGRTKKVKNLPPFRIIPLGGLDEIGKNHTVIEYGNEMIIIDCGLAFPDAEMLGIDLVIPDFSYVLKNKDKIKGIFITHGHEDHIGSLPYLLKQINVPVYGTGLTIGLINGKLQEHGIAEFCSLNVVKPGDIIKVGGFSVEFIHVNHSIPDAAALAIRTELGTIFHTGDFKIDSTPIDSEMIDIPRIAEIGKEGVLLMMSDSTNAGKPGYTMSEKTVGRSFENLFSKAGKRRILIATFSSNIHRIQQIIDYAVQYKRKVAVVGRSMQNVVQIGMDLGYLSVPEGILINIGLINRYNDEELVIVTTGSQGEPMSALYRMAFSDHKKVEITPNDFIIISASPIPGNEKTVTKVVNELMKLGAEVVYEKMYEVHVSGHACQEELKLMMTLVKPKFFMPVHGQQLHLKAHQELAYSIGMEKQNVLVTEIGKVIEITKDSMKVVDSVESGSVMVDGLGVGDVGSIVLNDRKRLAEDGLIVVVMSIDGVTGEVMAGPAIVSRGFVYVRESEQLMEEARAKAEKILLGNIASGVRDWTTLKNKVKDELSRTLYERTKRSPMILPIIMEV